MKRVRIHLHPFLEFFLDNCACDCHWVIWPHCWWVKLSTADSMWLWRNGHLDDDVLMALPELYRYGREGHWYSNKLFLVYMFDGIVQVSFLRDSPWVPANLVQSAILYFVILYAYRLTTARSDGYDVALYEFSTVRDLVCCFVIRALISLTDNGYSHRRSCQFIQWTLHQCLDGVGIFRRRNWRYTRLGIHGQFQSFIT